MYRSLAVVALCLAACGAPPSVETSTTGRTSLVRDSAECPWATADSIEYAVSTTDTSTFRSTYGAAVTITAVCFADTTPGGPPPEGPTEGCSLGEYVRVTVSNGKCHDIRCGNVTTGQHNGWVLVPVAEASCSGN